MSEFVLIKDALGSAELQKIHWNRQTVFTYDFISTHFCVHNEFHSVYFNEIHQSVTHPLACNENSLVKRQQKTYISYRHSSDLQPIIRFNNYPFSTFPTSRDMKQNAAAVFDQKYYPTNLTAGYFWSACYCKARPSGPYRVSNRAGEGRIPVRSVFSVWLKVV